METSPSKSSPGQYTSNVDSDDSFIVFEEAEPPVGRFNRHACYSDSSDEEECDDEDANEPGINECPNVAKQQNNKTSRPDSGFIDKKVSFNLRPKVLTMRVWQFAYAEARKGNWEQVGRDRIRFAKRIMDLTKTLSPILDASLRQKIYITRFCKQ